jgi:glycosyltransferase involved in cell wall biosynthesis
MNSVMLLTPTHAVFGGVESIVCDLCCHLPTREWKVTPGLLRGARFNLPEAFLQAHPGIEAVCIDGTAGTAEGRVRAIVNAALELQPNILFSARVYDAHEAARRLKMMRPQLRFALTIQAYEADYMSDLERWHGQVDFCVASGELIRRACEQVCGMEAERLASIPGGVRSRPGSAREFSGPLRIGYAGRLEQAQKRIGDLLAIAEQLHSRGVRFTLDVAGTGPEEAVLVPKLQSLLGGDFHFHGWIGDPEALQRFYLSLDVFVHMAGNEGVTIAPREAMAAGVVPVISEFPGFWTEGHFCPGLNCLSFPVGDIGEAARQIEALNADHALLTSLSRKAAESQRGIYSESGALEAWAAAFDRCMRLPAKPALFRAPLRASDTGRLSRWGIPPGLAQNLRDVFGRKTVHGSGGGEWPHAGPRPSKAFEDRLREFALQSEKEAREHWQARRTE